MARYHVRADGSMGVCTARSGQCPFGSEEGTRHFTSEARARAYSEERIAVTHGQQVRSLSNRGHVVIPDVVSDNGVTLRFDKKLGGYSSLDDGWATKEELFNNAVYPKVLREYIDDNELESHQAKTDDGDTIELYESSSIPSYVMSGDYYDGYDTPEMEDAMDALNKLHDRDYRSFVSKTERVLGREPEDLDDADDILSEIDQHLDQIDTLQRELDEASSPLDGFDRAKERDTEFYYRAQASLADLDEMKDQLDFFQTELDARRDEVDEWIDDYDDEDDE